MIKIVPATREKIIELLPKRPDTMHKGVRGRLLVMGGSKNYVGAPALSALGALRSGSGIVTLLSLSEVCAACAARLPEVVYRPVDDLTQWFDVALSEEAVMNAAVLGPGLGRSSAAGVLVKSMWQNWLKPLLVDGDGLFELALCADECECRENSILTPHEGEAARLLGVTPEKIRDNRESSVRQLADRWGCVLLKGHESLLACRGNNKILKIEWGGPELSVPGSGDVLSGCIGAFLAMGLSPFDAGLIGATLHGMAGDELRGNDNVDGVLASEIAHTIRIVLGELRDRERELLLARLDKEEILDKSFESEPEGKSSV